MYDSNVLIYPPICRVVHIQNSILWVKRQMDNKDELLTTVLNLASKGQSSGDKKNLTCAEAFKLARRYKMEIIEIGRICNAHNIKICKCQLGCFE